MHFGERFWFSPDSQLLAAFENGADAHGVTLFDLATGTCLWKRKDVSWIPNGIFASAHVSWVFSSDSKLLTLASPAGVELVDPCTGAVRHSWISRGEGCAVIPSEMGATS